MFTASLDVVVASLRVYTSRRGPWFMMRPGGQFHVVFSAVQYRPAYMRNGQGGHGRQGWLRGYVEAIIEFPLLEAVRMGASTLSSTSGQAKAEVCLKWKARWCFYKYYHPLHGMYPWMDAEGENGSSSVLAQAQSSSWQLIRTPLPVDPSFPTLDLVLACLQPVLQ